MYPCIYFPQLMRLSEVLHCLSCRYSSSKVYPPPGVSGFSLLIFFTRCLVQNLEYFLSLGFRTFQICKPWGSAYFSFTRCLVGTPLLFLCPPCISSITLREFLRRHIEWYSSPPYYFRLPILVRCTVPLTWSIISGCILCVAPWPLQRESDRFLFHFLSTIIWDR